MNISRVLIADSVAPAGVEVLNRTPGIAADVHTSLTPEELVRRIGEYEALIVRSSTRVTAQVIEAGDTLKLVARAGTGVDNVDVQAATKRGVIVMNTPGGNTVSTAEHTFSMLLALSRNIPQSARSLREGRWDRKQYIGTEARGKTLGIIGVGRIGREVALRARAFGMKVLGHDPFLSEDAATELGLQLATLEELYTQSDYITVHTPLTDETRHLISDAALAQCKDDVRIINCARGGIVDEEALLRAIESGKVAGAALDVFESEPPLGHPLLALDEVICTPHLGASTSEAQRNVAIQVAEQVADALTGGPVRNAVNFPPIAPEVYRKIQPYMDLAERIGTLQAQLGEGHPIRIAMEYHGEVLDYPISPITSAVLKGVMQSMSDESVNYVNAPLLAQERGVRVDEIRSSEHEDFATLITVTYRTTTGEYAVSGTIFGRSDLRIVRIGDYRFDVQPEGHMLMYANQDVPGIIGRVGTLLGSRGINIASMYCGRERPGAEAVTVLNVDSRIPDTVLAEIEGQEHILWAKRIKL